AALRRAVQIAIGDGVVEAGDEVDALAGAVVPLVAVRLEALARQLEIVVAVFDLAQAGGLAKRLPVDAYDGAARCRVDLERHPVSPPQGERELARVLLGLREEGGGDRPLETPRAEHLAVLE